MTNILTPAEAANFIRSNETDAVMLQLLPLVDEYLYNATGHDWTVDVPIHPTAILAAGMVLVYWYDNPTWVGVPPATLTGPLVQLEAEALKYRKYEFAGRDGIGAISLPGARVGDEVITLVGVYGAEEDQSESFESVITVRGYIQQVDIEDLTDNLYVVVLKHPAEDVRT